MSNETDRLGEVLAAARASKPPKRERMVSVRFTEKEHQQLADAAARHSLGTASLIHDLVLAALGDLESGT